MVLEHVACMYNTNASFVLMRTDTLSLDQCWGGWGQDSAMELTGTMAHCHSGHRDRPVNGGSGGEWGNCAQFLVGDGTDIAIYSANHESNYGTNPVVLTNICYYTEIANRWVPTYGQTTNIWRITMAAGGYSTRACEF